MEWMQNPKAVYDVFGYAPSTTVELHTLQIPFAIGGKLAQTTLAEECVFGETIREQPVTPCAIRVTGHGLSKPVIKPVEERQQELLSQINKYGQYSSCSNILQRRYKNISPKGLTECQDVLRWFTSRLPLSRAEATFFGIENSISMQLNIRIWDYGPWQTLARRATNWPVIGAKVSGHLLIQGWHYD